MPMDAPVRLISVVRDFQMYKHCILDNPWCAGMEKTTLDNRRENRFITVLYNEVLEHCADDEWLVFCHEDWHPDCDLRPILAPLDRNRLYGPIGVYVEEGRLADFIHIMGHVRHCRKDGKAARTVNGIKEEGRVDSFDCQCVIVHSSLVRRCGLRFDEQLSFDMYVEDFCVSAYERFGIESHTLDIPCTHYSKGSLNERFYRSLAYVQGKYAGSGKRYGTIVGKKNTFGRNCNKRIHHYRNTWTARLRYRLLK